jgi:4-amino-4-deoxy-L-arabinose transferase-like glycosyltransferase
MNIDKVICSPLSSVVSGCLAALIGFLLLSNLINCAPIVHDGKENLTVASNLIRYGVFSSSGDSSPAPDMKREPAWISLTAGLLLLTGNQHIKPEQLATRSQTLFKRMNAVFLALVVGLASGLAWRLAQRPVFAWIISLSLSLAALLTTPRLVNFFNNEPLAMLLLLAASALTHFAFKGTWRSAISLGLALGLLALTKAQFLYIAFIPIVVLGFVSRKQAGLALLAFALIVTPWIARNTAAFGQSAISERGKTVAAVRLIMVSEHRDNERACMAYAFTHPGWREQIGGWTGVSLQDFRQGARCERFNRETCFDMGGAKVSCAPFPEDHAPFRKGHTEEDWRKAVQYFFRGMGAGHEIEAGRLRFSDIAPLSFDNGVRYIQTFPLFAWRGMGFTAFPWLSVLLTLSAFALIFTRMWPVAVLTLTTCIFHIIFTNNIPRYHAIEIGVLILSMTYLLDIAFTSAIKRLSRRNVR